MRAYQAVSARPSGRPGGWGEKLPPFNPIGSLSSYRPITPRILVPRKLPWVFTARGRPQAAHVLSASRPLGPQKEG